jgi:hypothetical protein
MARVHVSSARGADLTYVGARGEFGSVLAPAVYNRIAEVMQNTVIQEMYQRMLRAIGKDVELVGAPSYFGVDYTDYRTRRWVRELVRRAAMYYCMYGMAPVGVVLHRLSPPGVDTTSALRAEKQGWDVGGFHIEVPLPHTGCFIVTAGGIYGWQPAPTATYTDTEVYNDSYVVHVWNQPNHAAASPFVSPVSALLPHIAQYEQILRDIGTASFNASQPTTFITRRVDQQARGILANAIREPAGPIVDDQRPIDELREMREAMLREIRVNAAREELAPQFAAGADEHGRRAEFARVAHFAFLDANQEARATDKPRAVVSLADVTENLRGLAAAAFGFASEDGRTTARAPTATHVSAAQRSESAQTNNMRDELRALLATAEMEQLVQHEANMRARTAQPSNAREFDQFVRAYGLTDPAAPPLPMPAGAPPPFLGGAGPVDRDRILADRVMHITEELRRAGRDVRTEFVERVLQFAADPTPPDGPLPFVAPAAGAPRLDLRWSYPVVADSNALLAQLNEATLQADALTDVRLDVLEMMLAEHGFSRAEAAAFMKKLRSQEKRIPVRNVAPIEADIAAKGDAAAKVASRRGAAAKRGKR